jgi:ribosomal protein S3
MSTRPNKSDAFCKRGSVDVSTLIALIAIGAIGLVVWIMDTLASAAKSAAVHTNQQKLEHTRRTKEAIRSVRENAPELATLREPTWLATQRTLTS